ncbi:hypothetical protein ACCT31_39030, partial [Rhizobium ruizarguesonis]
MPASSIAFSILFAIHALPISLRLKRRNTASAIRDSLPAAGRYSAGTPNYFRKLNYITTVLDLCHRDD